MEKILSGERTPLIAEPMNPKCRLTVLIPVYNESLDVVLMPLISLSAQTGVAKNEYEVVLIVSNNRTSATSRSPEFLQNQKIIKFLNFIIQNRKTASFDLSLKQKRAAAKIRKSGLVIHIIDKSSLRFASQVDSANTARNLAGAEICRRFLTVSAGRDGVIAMTDCDCRFSRNYIEELIRTFDYKEVNRAAGRWHTEVDPALPHRKFFRQALAIHFGQETNLPRKNLVARRLPLKFQKKDKSKKMIPISGQNMAVRARAWLKVDGIGSRYSFDDMIFAYKVSGLPGDSVYNPNFWVSTQIRVSERVGMVGLGRRVKTIYDSIEDFLRGRTNKVYIPDMGKIIRMLTLIHRSLTRGRLDASGLEKCLLEHGMQLDEIEKKDIEELAECLSRDFNEEIGIDGVNNVERMVLAKFYRHLPKMSLGDGI